MYIDLISYTLNFKIHITTPEGAKEKESKEETKTREERLRELRKGKERKIPRWTSRRSESRSSGFRSIQMKGKCIKLILILLARHFAHGVVYCIHFTH